MWVTANLRDDSAVISMAISQRLRGRAVMARLAHSISVTPSSSISSSPRSALFHVRPLSFRRLWMAGPVGRQVFDARLQMNGLYQLLPSYLSFSVIPVYLT